MFFAFNICFLNIKGEIEPGSYVLNTSQTAEEMLKLLSRADEKETETE